MKMENNFQNLKPILIIIAIFSCIISVITFFSITDGDGVFDCIELIYLFFIFVYGFLALLLFLIEDENPK